MAGTVSMTAEVPEPLLQSMQGFIEAHPNWDQYRLFQAALAGFLVQNGVTFTEPRSPYHPYLHGVTDHLRGIEKRLLETGRGPLFLQDHDSPTRFRNVWILPLDR